jgi:uncharacterized protein YeaO (DUF488 family)
MITIRRLYDPDEPGKQYKILIDRLWPRGIPKEKAAWDEWVKEIAPSNELRRWFNHDPVKWDQFKQRYKAELVQKPNELKKLKQLEMKYGKLILLYTAREKEHNHAVVLLEILTEKNDNKNSY